MKYETDGWDRSLSLSLPSPFDDRCCISLISRLRGVVPEPSEQLAPRNALHLNDGDFSKKTRATSRVGRVSEAARFPVDFLGDERPRPLLDKAYRHRLLGNLD